MYLRIHALLNLVRQAAQHHKNGFVVDVGGLQQRWLRVELARLMVSIPPARVPPAIAAAIETAQLVGESASTWIAPVQAWLNQEIEAAGKTRRQIDSAGTI